MTATVPTFALLLADGSTHTIEILHQDKLRAELEAPQQGLPTNPAEMPMATTTLWAWAACKRLGLTTAKYKTFVGEVLSLETAKGAADHPVDPTQQAQGTTPL